MKNSLLTQDQKSNILQLAEIVDLLTYNSKRRTQIANKIYVQQKEGLYEKVKLSKCKYCENQFPSHGVIGNHTRKCKEQKFGKLKKIVKYKKNVKELKKCKMIQKSIKANTKIIEQQQHNINNT